MISFNDSNYLSKLSSSIDNLTTNVQNSIEGIKNIANFFSKVSELCKNAIEILSNPFELLNSLQPYLIIAMMIMIILRIIGFKPEKWFRLCFIILMLSFLFN